MMDKVNKTKMSQSADSSQRVFREGKPPSKQRSRQGGDTRSRDVKHSDDRPRTRSQAPRREGYRQSTARPTSKRSFEGGASHSDDRPRTRSQAPRREGYRQSTPRPASKRSFEGGASHSDDRPRTRSQAPRREGYRQSTARPTSKRSFEGGASHSDDRPRTRSQAPRREGYRQSTPRSTSKRSFEGSASRSDDRPRTRSQAPRREGYRQSTPRSTSKRSFEGSASRSDDRPRTRSQAPRREGYRQSTARPTSKRSFEGGASHSDDRPRTRSQAPRREGYRQSGSKQPFGNSLKPAHSNAKPPQGVQATTGERVQKALSQIGWGARRTIESWIQAGEVWVNGKPIDLGHKVVPGDSIEIVRGRQMARHREVERYITWFPKTILPRVLLYHKPEGEIITRDDPQQRVSSFDKLPRIKGQRWVNVGRLDVLSSGLILFTNDGGLANQLTHPSSNIEREYAVRITGTLGEDHIRQLQQGIMLEDGLVRCQSVKAMHHKSTARNQWYKVVIMEGRNREIRRMVEVLDLQVSRLVRIRYGSMMLPHTLRRARYEELNPRQVEKLLRLLNRAK